MRCQQIHNCFLPAMAGLVTALCASTLHAEDTFFWPDNAGDGPPKSGDKPPVPDQGGDQWEPGGTQPAPTSFWLDRWDVLYVGIPNEDDGDGPKYVFLQIDANGNLDSLKASKFPGKGFKTGAKTTGKLIDQTTSTNGKTMQLQASYANCPDWEYISLKNTGASHTFTGVSMWSVAWCEQAAPVPGGHGIEGTSRTGCGCDDLDLAVTEMVFFPADAPLDMAIEPTLDAPPESGVWNYAYIFEDPNGTPRPGGGVSWTCVGPGLASGDIYHFSYQTIGLAGAEHDVFAFDAITGNMAAYQRDLRPRVNAIQSRHSTSGSLAMTVDPSAAGDFRSQATPEEAVLPTIDPRGMGLSILEITFDQAVTLANPLAIEIRGADQQYIPDSVVLDGTSTMMSIDVTSAGLPTPGFATIWLHDAIAELDTDIMFTVGSLPGDADQNGRVDGDDVNLINSHLGEPVDDTNVALDVDLDGFVTGADALIALTHDGDTMLCPGLIPTVPWYEDFDDYDPGTTLHGGCGWKGWDDDPAFDAPVTDAQAKSPSNSVQINGDSDLVHEFPAVETGLWIYEAWQYIPADFESGGGGVLAGSYVLMFNTYQDGVHNESDWAMQLQFNANDGLLHVFHGDGLSTINVPYETDRWVRIQNVVNLDDDWTRIYYDDELITEYSWTGAVTGEGGGALDIAAIDLFANGSSSIYYDDLRLEPIVPPCGGGADSDLDFDGFTLEQEARSGLDPCNPDTDDDGHLDGIDNCPDTYNPDQLDADDDDIGDACDEDTAPVCPADIDGSGAVDISDLLNLLASWGPCAGACPQDLDSSGDVGTADLLIVLASWGPC